MQKHISNLIKVNGFIYLDQFISLALCHPVYGYYSKNNPIKKDFITSPEITNAFGVIIGNFIFNKLMSVHGVENFQNIHFVEFGGGSGKLSFDMLNFILSLNKLNDLKINILINKINFHSIEFSDKLTLIQKNTLKNIPVKKHFWNNISEFSQFIKKDETNKDDLFIFFSNEFFDALPIKQFYCDGDDFLEIIVTQQDNQFIFEKIKINSEKFHLTPQENQTNKKDILEIPHAGISIIENICKIMNNNKSLFVTFDYGFIKNKKISTLQGVYNGQKSVNILNNVGESDITHLVNFPLLSSVFTKHNIVASIQTQKEFLIQEGIGSLIDNTNKEGVGRITYTMGDLFKVLIADSL